MNVLVLAPHTDDESLGCGGTIARLSPDHEVTVVAFSSGDPGATVAEFHEACAILGAKPILLGYETRYLKEDRQLILDHMIRIRDDPTPDKFDIVFVPATYDIHQDHQAVCEEALRAFKYHTILGYQEAQNNYRTDARYFVKLTVGHLDVKLCALRAYKTQKEKPYMDPEFVKGTARGLGMQISAPYAEAFEVIRCVV